MATAVNGAPMRRLSLAQRRWWIVALYGAYGMRVVTKILAEATGWAPLLIVSLIGLLTTVAAVFMLLYRTPYWAWGNNSDAQLDERERARRDQAYRTAYATYAGLTTTAGVYASLAVDLGWWLPMHEWEASLLLWGLLLLALTLPSAVIAWDRSGDVVEED